MLAGYHKTDGYSTEGAIKYFLLGSFSCAIFLFGLAFVWGITGHDEHRRRRGRTSAGSPTGSGAAVARPRHGPRVPDDRRRVQDRRRPVPLLDAGRVPGLADAGDRLPLGRAQDRRVRADHPAVRRGARAARGRLEHRDHGPRGADDDARQPRRADPGQREADARVLLDRAHRLHAGRASRRTAPARSGPRGAAVLRRRVHVHEPRRVRGDRGAPAAAGRHVATCRRSRASSAASRRSRC